MKKSHIKTYIIVAILISVIGISIAYAALQQQLQIKTNTTVQSSQTSWNISYETLNCSINRGYAKIGTMSVSGTTITLSGFVFQAPNSMVECYFNIINNGEISAKILSIEPKTVFTGSGTSKTTDETLISSHFRDLNQVVRWTDSSDWPSVKAGDKVLAGQTRKVALTFGINDMASLPTNPVNFSMTYTINFEQA